MQRLTVVFRKQGAARFLSHLDLMATLEYAARRARLPIALSEGFNPRPRLSLAASLALGYVGEAEILEIGLRKPLPPAEVAARLQAALPAGIVIISAEEIPAGIKTAASRLRSAHYRVELPAAVPDLEERIGALLACTTLDIDDVHDGQARRRDMRPLILDLRAIGDRVLQLEVRMDGQGSVRPEQILAALEVPEDGALITRERIIVAPPDARATP